MPTVAPKKEVERVLAPAGTFPARVFKFMNLGTRFQEYKGQLKDYPDTLINISWELPTELNKFTVKKEDGSEEEVEKPFAVSREFTLSMGKKSNLRPFVEGIIGTQLTDDEAYNFDLEELLGKACLITIAHRKSEKNGNTYANVISATPLIKGMEMPEAVNEQRIFNVNDSSLEDIEALPEWLRDKVKESDEYKERFDPATAERRANIEEELKKRGVSNEDKYPEEEINPEDIPF